MRRQDLLTTLVRHPDHMVLVDGNPVIGAEVTESNIILHTDKPAHSSAAADGRALEAQKAEHAMELARVREEDRRNAEAEITSVREAAARDLAAEQERAAAELAEVRAGQQAEIAAAVETALAAAKAASADQQ